MKKSPTAYAVFILKKHLAGKCVTAIKQTYECEYILKSVTLKQAGRNEQVWFNFGSSWSTIWYWT